MKIITKEHKKLVRDRISEIIQNSGGEAETEIIDKDEEYAEALLTKLGEEVKEAQESEDGHLLEELGDIETVIEAILNVKGWTYDQLTEQKQRKDEERGKFEKRIFLKSTKG